MPICQLLWHVVGAVQAVPFTFGIVAALVAVTVSIVVFTVLVIQRAGRKVGDWVSILTNPKIFLRHTHTFLCFLHLLALSFLSLTIKAIIETPRAVALAITLPIVKVSPALQGRRAVLPRVVKIKRAVSSIPAAGVVVAQRVADVVPGPLVTLRNLAADLHFRRRGDVPAEASDKGIVQDVAQQAVEVAGAAALEERHVWGDLARAAVVAGVGDAEAVGGGLALGPSEGWWTQAAWAEVARHTCTSVPAIQTPAGARIILARRAGEALEGQKWTEVMIIVLKKGSKSIFKEPMV